jgi:hypothetical protein
MEGQGRIPEDEYDDRIEFTLDLLVGHQKKSFIKTALKERWGISARTAENYIARARVLLLAQASDEQEFQRCKSIRYWETVIADPSIPVSEKRHARTRLDRIWGVDAPTRIAQTDTKGNDIDPNEARTRLSVIAAALAQRRGDS